MAEDPRSGNAEKESNNAVWTYQGYRLETNQFTTAMVHLYRAEIQRANLWRSRLDTTTNWSVVTSAGALTFAFSAPENPHFLLLLVLILLLAFLNIEARRYRYYELWYRRSRLLETDFFAAMVSPPYAPSSDWSARLENALLNPSLRMAWWEAIGSRFKRNYLWLISLILISWVIKLNIHPTPTTDIYTMIERATIGKILPGNWVVIGVIVIYVVLLVLAALASLPPDKRNLFKLRKLKPLEQLPKIKEGHSLATIITYNGEPVADQLMDALGRGVTALEGKGMYSGVARDVLLCVVTDIQIPQVREIVSEVDPEAFVIVSRSRDVRGSGFNPLKTPS